MKNKRRKTLGEIREPDPLREMANKVEELERQLNQVRELLRLAITPIRGSEFWG